MGHQSLTRCAARWNLLLPHHRRRPRRHHLCARRPSRLPPPTPRPPPPWPRASPPPALDLTPRPLLPRAGAACPSPLRPPPSPLHTHHHPIRPAAHLLPHLLYRLLGKHPSHRRPPPPPKTATDPLLLRPAPASAPPALQRPARGPPATFRLRQVKTQTRPPTSARSSPLLAQQWRLPVLAVATLFPHPCSPYALSTWTTTWTPLTLRQ